MKEVIFIIILLYILFCKVWPYFLYPNYLSRSRVESYREIRDLAKKLKGKTQYKTLSNINVYLAKNFDGINKMFRLKSFKSVFWFGDFSTKKLLIKNNFCGVIPRIGCSNLYC